jgi:chemotaxis protein methyltransferase CheR
VSNGNLTQDPTPKLRDEEFRLFCALFLERAGLSFSDASFYTFERRLGGRLVELGLTTFDEYYAALRFSQSVDQELEYALELVTTAETYFFRQEYQLRSFSMEVLPRLRVEAAEARRLTVWSAGCSTGEEVYTLAILIKESGLFEDWEVRVVGSDLCRSRINFARAGRYRDASFRVTDQALRERYFERVPDGWLVRSDIQAMCQFAPSNLLEPTLGGMGRVNVAFCRNVLIYLGSQARLTVLTNLYRRLSPGGYLFLGHSESLASVSTSFELVHLTGDLVYRKPLSTLNPKGEL